MMTATWPTTFQLQWNIERIFWIINVLHVHVSFQKFLASQIQTAKMAWLAFFYMVLRPQVVFAQIFMLPINNTTALITVPKESVHILRWTFLSGRAKLAIWLTRKKREQGVWSWCWFCRDWWRHDWGLYILAIMLSREGCGVNLKLLSLEPVISFQVLRDRVLSFFEVV